MHEEDTRRLNDPKYTFESLPPARMKFLGGYKYVEDRSVFYYNFYFQGKQMRVKIMYTGEKVIISAFQAGTQQNYKILVKDLPTVERIIDFAQKSSCGDEQEEFIRTASLFLFDRRKEQKGTIFCVNDMFSRKTSVLVDSSPSHMKYNILTEFSNVYIDNFFVKKTLFFSSITKNLGANYVTAKLFYSFKLEINQLIVLLIISPSKNRFKVHKLIMNNFDLKTYFNLDLLIYVHDERKLLILLNEVMEKLVTYKDILYTKVVIPSRFVKRVKETNYTCILKNVFDQRTLFHTNTQEKMNPRANFLEERILHSEVISKGVKRINNQYWIFIVSKNLIRDRYDFTLYNQKSKRMYTASMSHHDTYRMSDHYIYNIFKHSHDEIQQIESVSTSFVNFEEQLLKIQSFQINSSYKKGLKSKMLELQGKKGGYETILNHKKKHYAEIKFWMESIKLAVLYKKNGNLMLGLDTYTSLLKEQIWMSVVKDVDGSFEMNLSLVSTEGSKSKELSPLFRPIRHEELVNHILLLRIVFFDKSVSHNDKISLQQLFALYKEVLAEKIKQTHLMASHSAKYDSSSLPTETANGPKKLHQQDKVDQPLEDPVATHIPKINQAYLQDLARILETNVKANFKTSYKDVLSDPLKYSENEKILSKRIIYQDKFERQMKVNSKPNLAIQMDPNYKRNHDILLYRNLLTIDPREMLIILYNFEERRVKLVQYNLSSCQQRVSFKGQLEIEKQIPHMKSLMSENKFSELGFRIFKAFKNNILVHTFLVDDPQAQ